MDSSALTRFVLRRGRLAAIAAVALGLVLALLPPRAAADKQRPSYYFLVWKVTLADGVPAAVADRVKDKLRKAIEANPRLAGELPADAPDPTTDPKGFKKYKKRNKIRTYRVNVEVTRYAQEVEPMPPPRRGKQIMASIALRTFGEDMPDPSMAFAGDGSATVKMQVGKRVRARDREIIDDEVIGLAIEKALTESLDRLDAKLAPKRKRRPRKK